MNTPKKEPWMNKYEATDALKKGIGMALILGFLCSFVGMGFVGLMIGFPLGVLGSLLGDL